ncbi:sugar transferase [Candidatus Uhrbacteria bacterium]|nr:sugar transferase [Candidatus Uhrbacteria bacterium]
MKRSDIVFAAVSVPIDLLMLWAAGSAAYFLRFQTFSDIRPVIFSLPFSQYAGYVILVSLWTLLVFTCSGLYTIAHNKIRNEIQKIFIATAASIMAVIVFIFFIHELFSSRFIVLAAWILSFLFVSVGRMGLRVVRFILYRKGIGLHSIAVIGSQKKTAEFCSYIDAYPNSGYKLALRVAEFSDSSRHHLAALVQRNELDEIFILDSTLSHDRIQEIIDFSTLHHIGVRYSADIVGAKKLVVSMLAGVPLVEIQKTRLDGWGKIWKRIFDVGASILLLGLLAPVFALIALAIRIESPGPFIYRNKRVGQRGLFNTYKFRSMYVRYCTGQDYDASGNAEKLENTLIREKSERAGPLFKILNDPRRTHVGRFLERTSLDELPQLYNVLKGTMSLVGPRPHMPKEVAEYQQHHHQLFSVKPGVTGLAQIEGRSDLDFDDEARLDIYYIENWSPFFDFVILCKTPWAVITRKSRV